MTLISPRKAFPPSPAGAILVLYIAGIPATLPAAYSPLFPRPPLKAKLGECSAAAARDDGRREEANVEHWKTKRRLLQRQ
jgi:hypothetical protein